MRRGNSFSIKFMKKTFIKTFILIFLFSFASFNFASATDLNERLKGKILLQVEGVGQAWYIDPATKKRAFLGRPADAFRIMRELGLGISEKDYNLFNGYAPKKLSGKILLRVEANGEAYYVFPDDLKMYYLGRPTDAFNIMREKGMGITNEDLNDVPVFQKYKEQTDATRQEILSPDQQSDELSQSVLDEILIRTVKIICTSSTLESQGSGFISITAEYSNVWYVFTNSHVAVVGEMDDYNCVVGVPEKPYYSINNNFAGEIIDVDHNYPGIDKAVLKVTGNKGMKHSKDIMPTCKFGDVRIGDKMVIVGYPAFGGSSLTATEGTISGFVETQYGPIYKTSAKIDSGNSGGIAVDKTKKCLLGMPTWATQGTFEGLGYIQSFEMLTNSVNNK